MRGVTTEVEHPVHGRFETVKAFCRRGDHTVLVEHPWISSRRSRGRACDRPHRQLWLVDRPHLATWLGQASLLPIAALTLVPAIRDLAVGFATEWELPTLGAVDLVANVVLFIPPALLLGVAVLRPLIVLFGASIGSVLVEVTQAYVPALGRSRSTNDWLAPPLG